MCLFLCPALAPQAAAPHHFPPEQLYLLAGPSANILSLQSALHSPTCLSYFHPVTSMQKFSMATFQWPLLNEVVTSYPGTWVPP